MLRVFCGPGGGYGNELGVVREGSVMPEREERQMFAAKLGFSETVFVDDPERGVIDIYTPTLRLPFAGHPCVGVGWLLDVPELVTPAGVVGVRLDGEFSWIEARAEWAPACTLRRYGSGAEVDALAVPEPGERSEMGVPRTESGGGFMPGPGRTRPRGGCGLGRFPGGATGSMRTRLRGRRRCFLRISWGGR